MKHLLFFCILIAFCIQLHAYMQDIQKSSKQWAHDHIAHLKTEEIYTLGTIIETSYKIIIASVHMSIAKLIMQAEIANLKTLALDDTVDQAFIAQNNNTKPIKKALYDFDKAQMSFCRHCSEIKAYAPFMLQLPEKLSHDFITYFKSILIIWVKEQKESISAFADLKNHLISIAKNLATLQHVFENMIQTTPIKDPINLQQEAQCLSSTYTKFENTIAELTTIRKEATKGLAILFSHYFKQFYTEIYTTYQHRTYPSYKTLHHPDTIFL